MTQATTALQNRTQALLAQTMERLSTGLRVNYGADDAAGFSISDSIASTMGVHHTGLVDTTTQLQQANQGLTAIGQQLDQFDGILRQAHSSTGADAAALTQQLTQGLATIDSIAGNAGLTASGQFSSAAADTTSLGLTSDKGFDLSTSDGLQAAETAVQGAREKLQTAESTIGKQYQALTSAATTKLTESENLSSARSRINDSDFATETANLTRSQILQQAGTAVLAQANSNAQSVMALLRGA